MQMNSLSLLSFIMFAYSFIANSWWLTYPYEAGALVDSEVLRDDVWR